MGAIAVWGFLLIGILAALSRPWLGIVAYYFFVYLQPKWNWHYSIPKDVAFERYIIIAVLVGGVLRCRQLPPLHPWVRIGLLGLMGWMAIAFYGTIGAEDPRMSNFVFSSMWKMVLVAGFATVGLAEPNRMIILLRMATIGSLYSTYRITKDYLDLGFCRYIQDGWGFGTGSNQASMMFTGLAMISICLTLFEKSKYWRALTFISFVFQMHAVMLLDSRSCMLGAVAAIAIVVWMTPKTRLNVTVLFIGFLAGLVLAGPSVLEEFMSTFEVGEDLDASAKSRFELWGYGLSAFQGSPLIGYGPGMVGYQVADLLPQDPNSQRHFEMRNPHNTPIEVLGDYGFLGFCGVYVFFVPLMLISFSYLWRNLGRLEERVTMLAGFSGLLAVSIASIFSSSLMVEAYYMLAGMTAAAINSVWGSKDDDDQEVIDAELVSQEELEEVKEEWQEEPAPVGV
jgi:O-antigen ligase